ncbi:MAG: MTAP family purine nucleoside phosphorylase [Bdellovibrionales bacterium]|nr:MTAP family purine nucleoside phosphorylase [Bdellovibrionales bacterium]
MLAIIGGSGFESFDEFVSIEKLDRETPFGLASSGLRKVKIQNQECLFISRHGEHHEHLPSEVNYAANIFALKKYGAKAIVSFSAVGSLKKEYKPGDLVVPFQYIDRTKSNRRVTFLGDGLIGHVSLAKPICETMAEKLKSLKDKFQFDSHYKATYVCIEGPYFSTQAESKSYQQMGASIIGMTNFPEYALAREAGLPYLPCCWITDYDCWDDSIPHVTVHEVMRVMKNNNLKAFEVLKHLTSLKEELWKGSICPDGGLRTGLFMPEEAVPASKKEWLSTLRE